MWVSKDYKEGMVSIVVPFKDRMEYFDECLASIVAQTYRPIQIIIVDDGSSVPIWEFVQKFRTKTRNQGIQVEYLRHSQSFGAPAARNNGAQCATGEFVKFMDSDDVLLPFAIAKEVELLERSSIDAVYAKTNVVNESLKPLDRTHGRQLDGNCKDLLKFNWQTMCATYSRTALEIIGPWDETLPSCQDLEFSNRAIVNNCNLLFIDSIHSLYRLHNKTRIGIGHTAKGRALASLATLNLLSQVQCQCYRKLRFRLGIRISRAGLEIAGTDRSLFYRLRQELKAHGLMCRCLSCVLYFASIGRKKIAIGKSDQEKSKSGRNTRTQTNGEGK